MLAVLALRRLPGALALAGWLSPLRSRADASFVGWFGPIGVSAVLYATHAADKLGNHHIWTVTSLIVCGSIAVHGITATPLTRAYGSRRG